MKKFFTVLLSVLMVSSICLAASAEDGLRATGGATTSSEEVVTDATNHEYHTEEATDENGKAVKMMFDVTSAVTAGVSDETIEACKNGEVVPAVSNKVTDASSLGFEVKPIRKSNGEPVDVTNMAVTFTLNVSSMFADGTRVTVTHYHGDEFVEAQNYTVSAGEIAVTTTEGFSTFYVSEYKEESKEESTPSKSYDAKDKNQDGVVSCEEENGKGWVWSEAKKACVYSVTNTSTK